jgi:hypothetical protein
MTAPRNLLVCRSHCSFCLVTDVTSLTWDSTSFRGIHGLQLDIPVCHQHQGECNVVLLLGSMLLNRLSRLQIAPRTLPARRRVRHPLAQTHLPRQRRLPLRPQILRPVLLQTGTRIRTLISPLSHSYLTPISASTSTSSSTTSSRKPSARSSGSSALLSAMHLLTVLASFLRAALIPLVRLTEPPLTPLLSQPRGAVAK